MHNLLVAQSGGPTSAINATLSGVITEAMIQLRRHRPCLHRGRFLRDRQISD